MKLAIITARGGSKRIPRKNIRNFCGKPIIAYSIEAALESKCFDEVMVSTDDDEIADIARRFGAVVPFMRSSETSSDFATTAEVLLEVVQEYQRRSFSPEFICGIYPTAPFITSDNLNTAYHLLKNTLDADVAFPIVSFSYPIQRALRLTNNVVSFFNKEHALTRSQDLEPAYHDAGQFYWCRANSLLKNKTVISEKALGMILPEWQVQDIDNINDWILAEIKYSFIQQKKIMLEN